MPNSAVSPFQLIVGLHDVSEPAIAQGEELRSWVPFSRAKVVLESVVANAKHTGIDLHLTSDDAFQSDHDILMPWIVEQKLEATFFIPTRYIGQPGRMTVSQLRDIAGLGLRLGSHGARHINWAKVPNNEFLEDLREGHDALQQLLGMRIETVAPPFGGYDGRIVAQLREEGFNEIHTTRPGLALTGACLKPRNMIKPGNLENVLAISRRRGGWRDRARGSLRQMRVRLESLGRAS